jgi:hypothetical protein
MTKPTTPRFGTPEWDRADANELCRSREVPVAVFDFIAHNMSRNAARAAVFAMPVVR